MHSISVRKGAEVYVYLPECSLLEIQKSKMLKTALVFR